MKKSFIGGMALGAFLISLIPYRVQTYVMREGKATSRNAIDFLQLIGFDQKIVDKAHEKASWYLETGAWTG